MAILENLIEKRFVMCSFQNAVFGEIANNQLKTLDLQGFRVFGKKLENLRRF